MSTDTTVVLVHGARLVRRTLPILVGLLTLAAPLVGQARHGHFYHVNYYQVRPGQEKAYDSALVRSEEHTSELQSQSNLVCRLLLEKKKKKDKTLYTNTQKNHNHVNTQ